MVDVWDRRSARTYTEPQVAAGALRALYGTRGGRRLLPAATRRLLSELLALSRRRPRSAASIPAFCTRYGVALEDAVRPPATARHPQGWTSFADFFVRDWAPGARPVPADPALLLSPADGKLLVGPIDAGRRLQVKGVSYALADLLGGDALADRFAGGTWFVVRLTVDDAHRYLHAASGRCVARGRAGRALHTVGPWAAGRPVLVSNRRWYTVQETEAHGLVAQIEVGAILVGRVRNHDCGTCRRGTPKGRFELGGSTIVVLCQRGAVAPDPDLITWSARGVETRVRAGERIGIATGGNA
ncbi:phosphatidylserine decarboxylase [Pengzhenrongella sicca]|uniref:Phosphatidylserine decarboxylase n=1 Tax=Pengzhenrongella sicca TaxID=2819238 RepID=A0A8A4ZFR2_9MICO|nr:phosphatidylserine decarboxylase [Pengzhenrongella sicca]QTE28508.1 phosphatidylserine decarboxylase [Pengzhenrongella sicca]